MSGFFGGGGGTTPVNMVGATASVAGTAGYVPAPAAGEQNAVLGGQGNFLPVFIRPKFSTYSRFYGPMGGGAATGDSNVVVSNSATRAELNPIILPSGSVSKLGIFVSSSTSNGTGYLALYGSDSNCNPDKLITSGSFSYTSTDSNVTKTVTLSPSVAIKAGLYYTAHHATINATVRKTTRGNFINTAFYGYEDENNSFSGGANASSTITIASAGTWPDPAGTLTFGTNNMACVYVYVS